MAGKENTARHTAVCRGCSTQHDGIYAASLSIVVLGISINRDLFAFGAFCGDKIISTAFLLIIEKTCNPRFTTGRTGEIFSVYTLEEYRRQGTAYNLLKMLMEFAKKQSVDLVELKATKEGYSLYKKLGFYENNNDYVPMKFNFNT